MKKFIEAIFAWMAILWIMVSPFIMVVSSILTTIKWYALSNSVIQGIMGFIVGGLVSGLVMGIGIVAIMAVVYLVQRRILNDEIQC